MAKVLDLLAEHRPALLEDRGGRAQLEQFMARMPQLEIAQLGPVALVALGLLRLALERADPALELTDHVGHPQQVLAGLRDLSLGLDLLLLELRDPRGLIDDLPPVGRLARHDLSNTALLDDRVAALGRDPPTHE